MSDGRKRLSGAKYRKISLDKSERQRHIVEQSGKIDNFFKTTSDDVSAESEKCYSSLIQQSEPQSTSAGPSSCVSVSAQIYDNSFLIRQAELQSAAVAGPSSSNNNDGKTDTLIQDEVTTCTDDSTKPNSISNDPALWAIDDVTRDYVSTHGVKQDIDKINFSKSKRIFGDQSRYCSPNLFNTVLVNGEITKRVYIMYSQSTGRIFCVPCRLFGGITKIGIHGFDDWKHGNEALAKHENSSENKSCVLSIKMRQLSIGKIDTYFSQQLDEEKKYWRNVLQRVAAVVRSLACNGLTLRGHTEKFSSTQNCGNFIMAMKLIAEFDPFLAQHIEKYGNPGRGRTSYLSAFTYEQFINLMAEKVTTQIIEDVKSAKYYSIIVDSTPDISHVDQLAVVFRYVNLEGRPVERFLCFLSEVGHKAEDLYRAVMDILKKKEIDIQNCRGQSYDNAANMSGVYSGLQARIKQVSPTATYTPCSAHSLNLIGQCAANCCKESVNFFPLLQNIYTFFTASTHLWSVLQTHLKKPTNVSLKRLSETRWSARADACLALNKDWNEVMDALTAISENESEKPDTRCESSGYLQQLQHLETAILSTVWGDILQRFNVTSKQLQSIDIDLGVTSELYGSLANYVEGARNNYEHYEHTAIEKSSITDYDDTFKRRKKRKLNFDETTHAETEIILTGRKFFQVNTYNGVMDRLSSEINRRHVVYKELHNQFSFFTNLPALSTDDIADKATKLTQIYTTDLPADPANFINECLHFRGFLKTVDVAPRTALQLSEIIHEKGIQDIYPYINIAMRIFLCMPASNCTAAERSFSVLRRIKNYLCSSMAQTRLNSLAVLSIESNLARIIDYSDIIDSFALQQCRRKV